MGFPRHKYAFYSTCGHDTSGKGCIKKVLLTWGCIVRLQWGLLSLYYMLKLSVFYMCSRVEKRHRSFHYKYDFTYITGGK